MRFIHKIYLVSTEALYPNDGNKALEQGKMAKKVCRPTWKTNLLTLKPYNRLGHVLR